MTIERTVRKELILSNFSEWPPINPFSIEPFIRRIRPFSLPLDLHNNHYIMRMSGQPQHNASVSSICPRSIRPRNGKQSGWLISVPRSSPTEEWKNSESNQHNFHRPRGIRWISFKIYNQPTHLLAELGFRLSVSSLSSSYILYPSGQSEPSANTTLGDKWPETNHQLREWEAHPRSLTTLYRPEIDYSTTPFNFQFAPFLPQSPSCWY